VTDEFLTYRKLRQYVKHATINHTYHYADGLTHTNTIEGFWSLVKRAWYGQHHFYSKKYLPLYIAEACFKYNRRGMDSMFADTLAVSVGV
jgi:transposase-like protein